MLKNRYRHIKPITLSADKTGPHLLILGGVHGDEAEPIQAVQKLIKIIRSELRLMKGTLTCVPIVNNPAYENDSRNGPDGLDLARSCPGRKDGTLTEQIAWEISQLIRSVDCLIDMHTGGKAYEIYPLAGYMLHSDIAILEKQRKMASAFGLPVQWGTVPDLEGRTLSVARDARIPAIYTEYGGGQCKNPDIENALYKGCLNVMSSLNMITHKELKYSKPIYIVEDKRKNSGHLQIMHPAPVDGKFKAHVHLGDIIRKGHQIGAVQPYSTNYRKGLFAREDGILFMITKRKNVFKGEATAGILPITQPGKITLI